jgi:putative ABC transport system substrate-binding protein
MVADGGYATVGVDYTVLGKQVADMVKRIIDGQEISEIPVETLKEYKKIMNITTAKSLGAEITDKMFENFETVE